MEDGFFEALEPEQATVALSIWARSATESDPVIRFLSLLDGLTSQIDSQAHAQCLSAALGVSGRVLDAFVVN